MNQRKHYAMRCRMTLFLLLIGFLLPSTVPAAHAQTGMTRGTLIIAIAADGPPFAALAENGQVVGFDIDLMKTVARTAGLRVSYESVPFVQLIPGVATRLYDAALGCIFINDERKALIDFSTPYFTTGSLLAFSENSAPLYNLTDLTAESKISVIAESAGATFLSNHSSAALFPVNLPQEALELAAARVTDAAFIDEITLSRFQRANPEAQLQAVGGVVTTEQCAIAVSKENPRLLLELNAALTRLKNNGNYLAIYRRWFGSRPLTGPRPVSRPTPTVTNGEGTLPALPASSIIQNDPLVEAAIGSYVLTLTTEPPRYRFIELGLDGQWLESQMVPNADSFRGVQSLTSGQLPVQSGIWQVMRTDPIAHTVQISATVQISPPVQISPTIQISSTVGISSTGKSGDSETVLQPIQPREEYQLTIQDDGTVRGLYTLYQSAVPTVTLLLTETIEIAGKRVIQ